MANTDTLECMIVGCRREARKVVSLDLAPIDSPVPMWEAGAHIDIILPSGKIRQYSLCPPVTDGTLRISVLWQPDGTGGSEEVHQTQLVGRTVGIRGPRNHFPLTEAGDFIFIAGGIGITPILSMIEVAESRGAAWHLLYGGQSRETMAFLPKISSYDPDRITLAPQDEVGLPDLASVLDRMDDRTSVYCCGPEGLIRAVSDLCAARGRESQLHVERFGGSSGAPFLSPDSKPFRVRLERAGIELDVPADRTLLDVILDVLPETPHGCLKGYCGACETTVLDGEVEHNDEILSEEERRESKTMMPCVSRGCGSRLTLDL